MSLLRNLLKIACLGLLVGTWLAADVWLFDGCPDIQRINAYPRWLQTSASTLLWPVAASTVLLLGVGMFWRRTPRV